MEKDSLEKGGTFPAVVEDRAIRGLRKAVFFLSGAVVILSLTVWIVLVGKLGFRVQSVGSVVTLLAGALGFAAFLHGRRKRERS